MAESTPEERHLLHYPADGMKVGVNPPGFTWTGNESAENYSFVLSRIREAIDAGEMPFWEFCRHLADSALAEPLYPEPAPYKDGKFEASEWRRIYTHGKVGSPHHNLWTRMTRAHNSILINGRGQSYGTMAASGTIEEFGHTEALTIVTGECARAYNLPINELTVEQWEEHLDEPLPEMETEAQAVCRTVVFSAAG